MRRASVLPVAVKHGSAMQPLVCYGWTTTAHEPSQASKSQALRINLDTFAEVGSDGWGATIFEPRRGKPVRVLLLGSNITAPDPSDSCWSTLCARNAGEYDDMFISVAPQNAMINCVANDLHAMTDAAGDRPVTYIYPTPKDLPASSGIMQGIATWIICLDTFVELMDITIACGEGKICTHVALNIHWLTARLSSR